MKKLLALFAVVTLVGCTITDGSAIVTGIERAPISADQVRIYRVAPDNYEEIAMVSASAGHDFKSNSIFDQRSNVFFRGLKIGLEGGRMQMDLLLAITQ